jgi:hypothetical protein
MLAWYFSGPDRTLRYKDKRKIRIGDTHRVKPPIEMCKSGLHASERIIDALIYAPHIIKGLVLYRVRLSGEIIKGEDKAVGSERTYLASASVDKILREFARRQALINVEKIKPYCSKENYEVILKWLTTGDKKYRSAAWSAAQSAARSAARSAAQSAAQSAARSAAQSAAQSAARSAAWSTVESAARSAARSAVESAVESATESATESAAQSTARSAARSAAWSAANDMLTEMIYKACPRMRNFK